MRWFKWTVILTVFFSSLLIGFALLGVPLALLVWGLLAIPVVRGLHKDFPRSRRTARQFFADRERALSREASEGKTV